MARWNDIRSGMAIHPSRASQELGRIVIVGPSGAGKTTMATEFACVLHAVHLALDDLVWGEGWRRRSHNEFVAAVAGVVASGKWVVDGDYGEVIAQEVWPKADLIIWLDYAPIIFISRLVIRELRNGFAHVEPWAGYRAHLRWLIGKVNRSWRQSRSLQREVPGRVYRLAPEVPLLRLTSPAQAHRCLRELARPKGVHAGDSRAALTQSLQLTD